MIEQKLIPEGRKCECRWCEQGRFIKRCCSLLPEAEGKQLQDWYNALLDSAEWDGAELYWIEQRAKEVIEMVQKFNERRAVKAS